MSELREENMCREDYTYNNTEENTESGTAMSH